jgi:hypothetical protein
MTYGDLIRSSLTEIGVVAGGQSMKDVDADRALLTLIDLVDAWNAERLSIYTQSESTFPLTNGVQTYSLGAGGAFNVARPEWIDSGAFTRSTDVPTVEYHDQDPLTDAQWNAIRIKSLPDALVQVFRYVPSFPLGSIQVWPVPNVGTLSILLRYPTPLTVPATLVTVLSLPPGYKRALRTNLSVELAAGPFDRKINSRLEKIAIDSKATLQRRNLTPIVLTPDPLMTCDGGRRSGSFDIRSNGYGR